MRERDGGGISRDTFFQAAVVLKKIVRMFVQVLQRTEEGRKRKVNPIKRTLFIIKIINGRGRVIKGGLFTRRSI